MSRTATVVTSKNAPKAIGPYSQGICVGELLFTAGQIALDPDTGQMVEGGIEDQTHRACRNLAAVVKAAGSSLDSVIKVTVFMIDLSQFKRMNTVYGEYFSNKPPARSTVQVDGLPMGSLIEIECVALIDI